MSQYPVIDELEQSYLKQNLPEFNIGDTVRVQTRIVEGEKERIQAFTGIVVAKKGRGLSETFTLYRSAYGSNMERVFLLHSPRITEMEVMRSGKTRRAKLYYLRGRSGKAAKIREQFVGASKERPVEAAASSEESPQA